MRVIYNGFIYESSENEIGSLLEEKFTVNDLDTQEISKIYEMFKSSYEASTGASWSESKFYDRARSWVFYGDRTRGFVSTRPQRSGAIKLTGMAGSPISATRGVKELMDTENKPIWGLATKEIVNKTNMLGLISPPAFIVKLLFKMIPPEVFGGVPTEIQNDGGVKFSYSDVGDSVKYFFANKEYFKWLFTQNLPEIPTMAKFALDKFKKYVLG